MWHLRDQTILPLAREYFEITTPDPDAYLQVAEAVDNGDVPTDFPSKELEVVDHANNAFVQQVCQLHEKTPQFRDQYSDLFDTLNTLGKAIHYEDTDTIDSFYR